MKEMASLKAAPIVLVHKDHPLDPAGVNAGAETAALSLARAFQRLGREVFFIGQIAAGAEVPDDGVRYLDCGDSYDTQACFRELELELNYQAFHLIVNSRAQVLLETRDNPLVLSRTFISHEPATSAFGVEPSVLGKVADRVVAISEVQRAALVEAGCAPERTLVVPNGASTDIFTPGAAERRDWNRLVFAGALVVDKGVHLLVEAFCQLKSRFPELKLDIYGTASLWGREDYFDVEQAKTISGLTFHGAVSQSSLAEAFRGAGLAVLPSIYFDAFNLVAAEAQVSGLPVIGAGRTGMREIIEDGVTGLLLDEINRDTIVQAVENLITSPEQLKSMSEAAISKVRPRLSWEKTASTLVELAEETAQEGSCPENLRLGLLSTYNQNCGLATYARYLVHELGVENVVVLAEDVPDTERNAIDDSYVHRVWRRKESDFSRLEALIAREKINVLHLNCHTRFFDSQAFCAFLGTLRGRGVKVLSHVHNPYTVDKDLIALISQSDEVLVHTPENKVEVIANGGVPERTRVIEHGVDVLEQEDANSARDFLGIPRDQKVLVSFGFIQAHKGIDEVIQALGRLGSAHNNTHYYIVGSPMKEDPTSAEYFVYLKQLVQDLNLSKRVHFEASFVPEDRVNKFLLAADAVIMNYRSTYYEASGAAAKALGAGAAVICSIAPPFARFGSAVFRISSGFPLEQAIDSVLASSELRNFLQQGARAWAAQHSWKATAKKLTRIYQRLLANKHSQENQVVELNQPVDELSGVQRVLMQNRSTALSHPGGDTTVMLRVAEELQNRGIQVDIDLEGQKSPAEYDLVHLYNFATPEITKSYAEKCVECDTPFIVTTMYEDKPSFYHQKLALFDALRDYVAQGQNANIWPQRLEQAMKVPACGPWENTWTAERADALIATGKVERANLERDYPGARSVKIYHLGADTTCSKPVIDDNGEAFRRQYGLKDYILCVARLETRKNQLMLLKALEKSDLTIVFATGGVSYQPEYEAACRNFKRTGKTIFVERLDEALLASAYSGAKAHVLPSWYELPGIVSLEAGRYGTNVVVTDFGTARDYFGELAYYCSPDNTDSIYQATMAAYFAPVKPELKQRSLEYTWSKAADRILEIYQEVLQEKNLSSVKRKQIGAGHAFQGALTQVKKAESAVAALPVNTQQSGDLANQESPEEAFRRTISNSLATAKLPTAEEQKDQKGKDPAQKRPEASVCEEADGLLRQGALQEAREKYEQALAIAPKSARTLRSLGVLATQQEDFKSAREFFSRGLEVDPGDVKSVVGLGACAWADGDHEKAYELYLKAFNDKPDELSTLLYLIGASYTLDRLSELEICLQRYLRRNPDSQQMRYCLAGCFFKQGKLFQAQSSVEQILAADPEHEGAAELKLMIERKGADAQGESLQSKDAVQVSANAPGINVTYQSKIDEKLRLAEEAKLRSEVDRVFAIADEIVNSEDASPAQRCMGYVLRGESRARKGDLEQAERDFQAGEKSPASIDRASVGRGVVSALLEQWDKAEALFRSVWERNNDHDGALAGLGMCFRQSGDNENAWDYFLKASQVNPENVRAVFGVLELAYPLGKLEDLEGVLRRYLDIHPANLSMLYAYAGCCYARGKYSEAIQQIEKIKIFDPEHSLANELQKKIELEGEGKVSNNR